MGIAKADTRQTARDTGPSHRISLCDQSVKANAGYRSGLSSAGLPSNAVSPRRNVPTLRANSARWLEVAVMTPRAAGSHTARSPERTVSSTERKSGAMPGRNGRQRARRMP